MAETVDYRQIVSPHVQPLTKIFDVESLFEGNIALASALPVGWTLNKMKGGGRAIVTNPTLAIPELSLNGLAVKILPYPENAQAMALAYKYIEPAVKAAEFPLLFPLAIVENAVVFPFVHGITSPEEDVNAFSLLKRILRSGGINPDLLRLRLSDAGQLRRFNLENGTKMYTDPFEDNYEALREAVKQYGL